LPSRPDPRIVKELSAASRSADIRSIQQRYEANDIHASWPEVPYVQRAALLLARAFQGDIFHDLDTSDF
jgi:hypothetical protein